MKRTSRARKAAWYQSPLQHDFQLHIRPDGPEVATFFFDRPKNAWSHGPVLTPDSLTNPERLAALGADIIRSARSRDANSIGIVIHIADEFATAELKPDLNNPGALDELRATAVHDPASLLVDSNLGNDQFSWRVIPYPAAGGESVATTVALSRQHAPLLAALRHAADEADFPMAAAAFSAPLTALSALDRALRPSAGKPFVAILQYPWFTVMAFFNEHADLRLLRTLPHRGIRRATNFRNTLSITNASLEFIDPDLFLVPLGEAIDTTLAGNLALTFPASRVETLALSPTDAIPAWCPEPALAALPAPEEKLITSHTFATFAEDQWAQQDFLPVPKDRAEIFPSRADLRLLRSFSLARAALFLAALAGAGWFAFGMFQDIRSPEWAFDPAETGIIRGRLAKFTQERQNIATWGNLLEDRSKTWSTMESLARLAPEGSGLLVKDFTYSAKPEAGNGGQPKAGFVKEWKITGFARDNAIEALNTLNTREGISDRFAEIAKFTGDKAFDTAIGNRLTTVNVRTSENPTFKPVPPEETTVSDESSYGYTFDLRITQRFETADPLALGTAAATASVLPPAKP